MSKTVEDSYKVPSILNIISYGSAGFWNTFAYTVFGTYVFFFYEAVVGLDTIYVFTAMIIFTLWDAVNDPLIGHLTDRITKITRKLGKRFPWIVLGIIPANLIFILLFTPPAVDATTNPLPIFAWITIITCLFDSFTTLCFVNVNALFPDKFRNDSARRKARGWGTPLSMLALPISTIIPPLLIRFQDQASYITMAAISVMIIATVSILFLPGMAENTQTIERYYVTKEKRMGFFTALKSSLKQQSFLYYIILLFGFQVVINSLTGSIAYAVNFVLQGSELDVILLFAAFLNGAIVSVPIWIIIAKRIKNNKKTAVIGGVVLTIGTLLTAFYVGVIDSMIYQAILGFTMGNFWALMTVYFSDVMDERMVLTRSDQRGAMVGIEAFFSRLSRGAQVAIFAIVHELTGFIAGATTQLPAAQIGIRLHMSVIPAIILAICTLIFWKGYPLTPEKSFNIKKQLKELGF